MHQMVLDGEWTYDKFAELCKNVYMDENGNTIKDIVDTYAFMHCGYWQVNFMSYGTGLSFSERDDSHYPVLALNNERSILLAEKHLTIFNNSSEIFNATGGSGDDLDTASQMLDITTENQYTDFLGANSLGGLDHIFIKAVQSGQNPFTSSYVSFEQVAVAVFQQYIEAPEG